MILLFPLLEAHFRSSQRSFICNVILKEGVFLELRRPLKLIILILYLSELFLDCITHEFRSLLAFLQELFKQLFSSLDAYVPLLLQQFTFLQ
jgi:hypothetical protein